MFAHRYLLYQPPSHRSLGLIPCVVKNEGIPLLYNCTRIIHTSDIYIPSFLSPVAVLIGFEQDSRTVPETDESVTLCVNMTTGSSTVPVSLVTLDIGSAQGI